MKSIPFFNSTWVKRGKFLILPVPVLAGMGLIACDNKQIPLIEQKCGVCHKAEVVYQKRYSPERWEQVIHGMKAVGLKLTEAEEKQIVKILAQHFSPGTN